MSQVNAAPLRDRTGFRIEGIEYKRGRGVIGAPNTPETNNCLIERLRQCLSEVHGLEFQCDRNLVRADLQERYQAADEAHVTFSSFLDVTVYGKAILNFSFAIGSPTEIWPSAFIPIAL